MLLSWETMVVVNDKEKRELRLLQVFDAELKILSQWLKPRNTMAADQIIVAKKLLKGSGAKGLACSCFRVNYNQ